MNPADLAALAIADKPTIARLIQEYGGLPAVNEAPR
jgi:hypothetical protein